MNTPTETIMMFKPDARDIVFCDLRQDRFLHEVAAGLLVASGLEIARHSVKTLQKNEVRAIYAKELAPNPRDDAIWGTAWKDQVVDHISSGLTDSYLVRDPDNIGLEVVRDLKNWLRSQYDREGNVVQNIAHVPDPEEIEVTKSILFTYE